MRAYFLPRPRLQRWLTISLALGLLLAASLACGPGFPRSQITSLAPSIVPTGFCLSGSSTRRPALQETLTTVVTTNFAKAFSLTLCHLDPATGLLVGHDDLTLRGNLAGYADGVL
jgi:hypothetical protein